MLTYNERLLSYFQGDLMAFKPSKNKDELCYPFIYETSYLCDYEVATDELCNHIGLILSCLPERFKDVEQDLMHLQPLIYHLNGSIRGKLAIEEADYTWLLQRYHHYQCLTEGVVNGFVLPRGPAPIGQIHLARSVAKKAIRLMVRVDEEGRAVPEILAKFCNLLCNFFFVLTVYINHRLGMPVVAFTSKSYGI